MFCTFIVISAGYATSTFHTVFLSYFILAVNWITLQV